MLRITVRSILMLSGMAFLQAAPLAGHAAETCDYFEGKNLFGQTVVEPWLTVRDQSTRDLTAFQAKCPGFDVTQIDVKVMDPAPWIVHKKKS
jgi:hypothetical protein